MQLPTLKPALHAYETDQPDSLETPSRSARPKRTPVVDTFSWLLSGLIHAGVLSGLYAVAVYEDKRAESTIIIPEPNLSAASVATKVSSGHTELSLTESALSMAVTSPTPIMPAPDRADGVDVLPVPSPSPSPMASASRQLSAETAMSASHTGPISSFFGETGNAYKVVYVLDLSASISMVYLDHIIPELRASIERLVPLQRFHIILAEAGRVTEFGPKRLVPATKRHTDAAREFVDAINRVPGVGAADPIAAMRRAFAVEPEMIYFLTDGFYTGIAEELERTLAELNADGAVQITTIGFDAAPAPKALLERIARNHGGHCRFVELEE